MSTHHSKSGTKPADESKSETLPADVTLEDLDAEFAAYQADATEDQANRDDADPFGAALGHTVLLTGRRNTGFTRGSRFNPESVPASIRKFVEMSLTEFHADEVDGVKLKPNTAKYRVVPFATADDAQKFVKHAKRYGLHRAAGKLSVRAYPVADKPTHVKVAVQPYQARGPKNKTTAAPLHSEPAGF